MKGKVALQSEASSPLVSCSLALLRPVNRRCFCFRQGYTLQHEVHRGRRQQPVAEVDPWSSLAVHRLVRKTSLMLKSCCKGETRSPILLQVSFVDHVQHWYCHSRRTLRSWHLEDFSFLNEFPFVTCDFQEYGWLWFTWLGLEVFRTDVLNAWSFFLLPRLGLAFFINVILLPAFLFSLGWYISRKVGPLWSSCRWLQPECQLQSKGGSFSLELIAAEVTSTDCSVEELKILAALSLELFELMRMNMSIDIIYIYTNTNL